MATNAPAKIAYSINEAAAAAGIGRGLLYREIGAGKLGIVKIGKRTLVTQDALSTWLENAATTGPRAARARSH
jgi:excisionase family DNA binding protein